MINIHQLKTNSINAHYSCVQTVNAKRRIQGQDLSLNRRNRSATCEYSSHQQNDKEKLVTMDIGNNH